MRYDDYYYNNEISDINNIAEEYYNNGTIPANYYEDAETLADQYNNYCGDERTHVHEYLESTKFAEEGDDKHNHRLAGVTGEAIPIRGGRNHVHKINNDNTDYVDHYHKICVTTSPAISIPGTNKHVHIICGKTTTVDGHCHKFLFTTQIEAPTE